MDDPSGLGRLPPEIQERIDAELQRRRLVSAVVVLRDQARLDPKSSLYEAHDVVVHRLRWLTAHGTVEPEPTVAVEDLLGKARAIPAPIVAIEAIWDGDTQGWFVELLATVDRPGRRHQRFDEVTLVLLRHGGDIRLFNGDVPPGPEATEAVEKGEALATALTVPFYFASPSIPDDQTPRWWDQAPGPAANDQ